jgi:hypothetical protein
LKMRILLGAGALALALTACGPGDVQNAANEAAATVTALVPAGAEETAAAIVADPTVAALAADPTVSALAGEAEAMIADPQVQSALDQAFSGLSSMTLADGQALTLDALSAVPNITNYTMTVTQAPDGAGVAPGTVIKEASNGNISLNPDEYAKYFTVAGDYRIKLDIVSDGNKTASHEFTVTVP